MKLKGFITLLLNLPVGNDEHNDKRSDRKGNLILEGKAKHFVNIYCLLK
jgi:hypothetical protein